MRRMFSALRAIASNSLLPTMLALACSGIATAGTANMQWAPANTTAYSTGAIVSCGVSQKVDIKVAFTGSSCSPSFGSNPYQFEFFLYRNGVQIGHIPYQQGSSCWRNGIFYSVNADAGTYSAIVNFKKRRITGWQFVSQDNSSTITASKTPATPAFVFTLTNQSVDASTSPKVVINILQPIIINAAATNCETAYYIGAQESDENWIRTNQYEWGKWFPGDAPSSINLQQLATTYSNPPDYFGDLTRCGTPLFGGDISPGVKRHYRVFLCTAEPTWVCATALLRVNP